MSYIASRLSYCNDKYGLHCCNDIQCDIYYYFKNKLFCLSLPFMKTDRKLKVARNGKQILFSDVCDGENNCTSDS